MGYFIGKLEGWGPPHSTSVSSERHSVNVFVRYPSSRHHFEARITTGPLSDLNGF
jgi:hypothetical protein